MSTGFKKAPLLFIGTYTEPEKSRSEGIYVYRMDPSSGKLAFERVVKGVVNPSFLTFHPEHNFLYAVNEVRSFAGQSDGGVSAFSIDPTSGEVTPLNQQPSYGDDPCYISVEQTGRYAMVANYTSGCVATFPILPDGKLSSATQVIQESGFSVVPERQTGPHTHCVLPDSANRYAIVADLGLDKLMVYRIDLQQGKLQQHAEVNVQPGAGPRHMAFHPNGQHIYLINELNSTLTCYFYQDGSFTELQTVSALPENFKGKSFAADVHISPDGKYLYASNRGHDSIVCFQIDEGTGWLNYRSHTPCGGKEPRNFAIDPSGTFLLVANQKTNNIVTFKRDLLTGELISTRHKAKVSMPVCLKFY